MATGRALRIMLTDGREFTLDADSYRRVNSIDQGAGHAFMRSGDSVCFVPNGQLAAVITETALRGAGATTNGAATNGKAHRSAGRRLAKAGKRNGKGRH